MLVCGAHAEAMRKRFAGLDHVHVEHYVSYSALFEKARALVHQGGIGTVAEALRAGRPSFVVPFGQDQYDNAVHIEKLKAGFWLGNESLTSERLARSLDRLTSETFDSYPDKISSEEPIARALADIKNLVESPVRP